LHYITSKDFSLPISAPGEKDKPLIAGCLPIDPVRLSLSSQVFREPHHALRRGWIVVLVVEALSHTVHLSAL
jgi:hypothetical protein